MIGRGLRCLRTTSDRAGSRWAGPNTADREAPSSNHRGTRSSIASRKPAACCAAFAAVAVSAIVGCGVDRTTGTERVARKAEGSSLTSFTPGGDPVLSVSYVATTTGRYPDNDDPYFLRQADTLTFVGSASGGAGPYHFIWIRRSCTRESTGTKPVYCNANPTTFAQGVNLTTVKVPVRSHIHSVEVSLLVRSDAGDPSGMVSERIVGPATFWMPGVAPDPLTCGKPDSYPVLDWSRGLYYTRNTCNGVRVYSDGHEGYPHP